MQHLAKHLFTITYIFPKNTVNGFSEECTGKT